MYPPLVFSLRYRLTGDCPPQQEGNPTGGWPSPQQAGAGRAEGARNGGASRWLGLTWPPPVLLCALAALAQPASIRPPASAATGITYAFWALTFPLPGSPPPG